MSTSKKTLYIIMALSVVLFLTISPIANAQNWASLPPYNTLWPLWSPALSPIDAVSGLPVPLVTQLTPSTVLPIQPALTWDPAAANPWLLYNTPLGMAYYDPIGGVNLWPPSNFLDVAGSPLPISLPVDYGYLPPTDPTWLTTNVPLANAAAFAYLMLTPSPFIIPTFAPVISPTAIFGPFSTTAIGPTATPIVAPTFSPIFGIGFTPTIAGVPLFLSASALLP